MNIKELDVPVVLPVEDNPETTGRYIAHLQRVARRLTDDQVDVVVWVGLVLMMPLAFDSRVASVRMWWSVKYDRAEGAARSSSMKFAAGGLTDRVHNIGWVDICPMPMSSACFSSCTTGPASPRACSSRRS